MTAPVNVPFGAPPAWFAVVADRAGLRCECTGHCGVAHSKTKGRCPQRHEGWHNHRTTVLTVAPKDVTVSLHAAVSLSPRDLMAWCAGCLSGAKLKARKAAEAEPACAEALFDAPAVETKRGEGA